MKGFPLHQEYLLWEDDQKIQIEPTTKVGQRLCFYRSSDIVTVEECVSPYSFRSHFLPFLATSKPTGTTKAILGIIGIVRLTIGTNPDSKNIFRF